MRVVILALLLSLSVINVPIHSLYFISIIYVSNIPVLEEVYLGHNSLTLRLLNINNGNSVSVIIPNQNYIIRVLNYNSILVIYGNETDCYIYLISPTSMSFLSHYVFHGHVLFTKGFIISLNESYTTKLVSVNNYTALVPVYNISLNVINIFNNDNVVYKLYNICGLPFAIIYNNTVYVGNYDYYSANQGIFSFLSFNYTSSSYEIFSINLTSGDVIVLTLPFMYLSAYTSNNFILYNSSTIIVYSNGKIFNLPVNEYTNILKVNALSYTEKYLVVQQNQHYLSRKFYYFNVVNVSPINILYFGPKLFLFNIFSSNNTFSNVLPPIVNFEVSNDTVVLLKEQLIDDFQQQPAIFFLNGSLYVYKGVKSLAINNAIAFANLNNSLYILTTNGKFLLNLNNLSVERLPNNTLLVDGLVNYKGFTYISITKNEINIGSDILELNPSNYVELVNSSLLINNTLINLHKGYYALGVFNNKLYLLHGSELYVISLSHLHEVKIEIVNSYSSPPLSLLFILFVISLVLAIVSIKLR